MNRKTISWIALIIFGMAAIAGATWGGDIKARMRDRLPDIVKFKNQGVIGENNQGYLAILKNAAGVKALVDAENQDRGTIYRAIAQKQGTTAELVGQRRAMQIAEKADAGEMIQGRDGKWMKK